MDTKTIESWLKTKRGQIEELEGRIHPYLEELESLRHDVRLLEELAHRAQSDGLPQPAGRGSTNGTPPRVTSRTNAVTEAVYKILREAGGSLHISDLRTRMLEKGHPIPGKGEDANLIVHISKDPRIARVGRGTYDLVEHGAKPMPQARKRRKKTTRRRKTSR